MDIFGKEHTFDIFDEEGSNEIADDVQELRQVESTVNKSVNLNNVDNPDREKYIEKIREKLEKNKKSFSLL